jgi:transcriptional regulator with XRE-family HTH domain
MMGDPDDLIVLRARLVSLRQCLGVHLATRRHTAGVSQGELAQALGRTRSLVSKVEHGARSLPESLWKIADEVCRAEGALIAEHSTLAQTERDYQARWRAHHRVAGARWAQPLRARRGQQRDGDRALRSRRG